MPGAGAGRHQAVPARPAPGSPDAWAAAEAQHRAHQEPVRQEPVRQEPVRQVPEERRVRPVAARPDDETVYDGRFTPAAVDPDGWSVAPAVIGGDLPEAAPAPPPAPRPAARPEPETNPTKRSFLGKLFNRNG
ncbi:hypothetical protein ABZ816_09895 [Actinosynnema sp. NPDC047251]|uniref:Uncharacterized protein n=1 Tax=Saccharothrix espanaensis (strain ATCC 51144 / DSM 44229 / JCM 9112 / NBRC 15066 / NRRL 15764) TaxID=1179773 RepID=K0K9D5_SACES|nr:hypothetical protein [Saccharothrix espanaensis]CCH34122.1 hypothetical protein BN6_68850 [Saccharothrix espanaensis DSM 44229]